MSRKMEKSCAHIHIIDTTMVLRTCFSIGVCLAPLRIKNDNDKILSLLSTQHIICCLNFFLMTRFHDCQPAWEHLFAKLFNLPILKIIEVGKYFLLIFTMIHKNRKKYCMFIHSFILNNFKIEQKIHAS